MRVVFWKWMFGRNYRNDSDSKNTKKFVFCSKKTPPKSGVSLSLFGQERTYQDSFLVARSVKEFAKFLETNLINIFIRTHDIYLPGTYFNLKFISIQVGNKEVGKDQVK